MPCSNPTRYGIVPVAKWELLSRKLLVMLMQRFNGPDHVLGLLDADDATSPAPADPVPAPADPGVKTENIL